jgi:hypothetical protein
MTKKHSAARSAVIAQSCSAGPRKNPLKLLGYWRGAEDGMGDAVAGLKARHEFLPGCDRSELFFRWCRKSADAAKASRG